MTQQFSPPARSTPQRDEGHRAFLELGGAELIYEAVRNAAPGRIAYGVPLDQALGDSECEAFLRNVLHVACEGLKDGRSTRLIRDGADAAISLGRRDIVMENPAESAIIQQWMDEAHQGVNA